LGALCVEYAKAEECPHEGGYDMKEEGSAKFFLRGGVGIRGTSAATEELNNLLFQVETIACKDKEVGYEYYIKEEGDISITPHIVRTLLYYHSRRCIAYTVRGV
jgi:hypothetical protein